jgi:bla regulator protein BlaR1
MPSPLPAGAIPWTAIDALADWLVRTTAQGAVLVALVAIAHATLGRWLAPRWRFALWLIVVVRLLMPAAPASRWSLFNVTLASAEAPRPAVALASAGEAVAKPPATAWVYVGSVLPAIEPLSASTVPRLPPARHPWREWRTWVVLVWLAGLGVAVTRVAIGVAAVRRKLRGGRSADADTLALLGRCARELGLRRPRR